MSRFLLSAMLFATPSVILAAPLTDRQGEPLPPGAIARFGSARMLHGPNVKLLRFSTDGKALMSSDGRELRVWDLATGRSMHRLSLRGLNYPVFRPDLSVIYLEGGSQRLCHLDLASGTVVRGPEAEGLILSMPSSVDGQIVELRSKGEAAGIYSFLDGKRFARLPAVFGNSAQRMTFSRDGRLLLSYEDDKLQVWDRQTEKRLAAVAVPMDERNYFRSAVFSPDGRRIVVVRSQSIRVYDARSLREERAAFPRTGWHPLSFTPDGKGLQGISEEGRYVCWSEEGRRLPAPKLNPDLRYPCAFSAEGDRLAFVHPDGRIRVLNLLTDNEYQWPEREAELMQVRCIDSGMVVAVSYRNEVIFWKSKDGRESRRIKLSEDHRVQLSGNGQYAAQASRDGPVIVYDLASGNEAFRGENSRGLAVFSDDGKLLLTDSAEGYRLWSTQRKSVLREIRLDEPDDSEAVVFSPDNRTIVRAKEDYFGKVSPIEVASGRARAAFSLDLPFEFVPTFSFVPDLARNRTAIAHSRDGRMLGIASSRHASIRSTANPNTVHHIPSDYGSVFALSPGGKWLAQSLNRQSWRVALYDLRSRPPFRPCLAFTGHDGTVMAMDFTPDGKHLVSVSDDGTALVWDVARYLPDPNPAPPNDSQFAEWWELFGDPNPKEAGEAMDSFEEHSARTVPFFKAKMRPVEAPPPGRVAALIRDLDSKKFATRQQATSELEKLGELAEAELEAVLSAKPTLELASRVGKLLDKLQEPLRDPQRLRELRAVEVLEKIGSPEARVLLQDLAKGHASARLTREAKSSLERWPKQEETHRKKGN